MDKINHNKPTGSNKIVYTGGQMMKRKLATLTILLLGMAFSGNAGAVELGQGKVDIHGFITQGYLVTDENNFMADTEGNGSFQYSEAGVNFASDVSERLRLGVQFIARDLGKMGNKEVSIDWAVADYSVNDWLNFRAGKGKLSHGLYNYERDVDMLRASVLLPQSVYTEGWRDSVNAINGISAYGYLPMGPVGNLTYHVDLGNTSVKSDGGEIRQLEDTMPKALGVEVSDADTKTTLGGQLAWDTIFGIDGLRIAASGFNFEMDASCEVINGLDGYIYPPHSVVTPTENVNPVDTFPIKVPTIFNLKLMSTVGSLEFARGNFVFAAEYMNNNYEMTLPIANRVEMGIPNEKVDGKIYKKFDAIGYYGSVSYRFTDWLELGTYYSEYYRDKDDKDGDKALAAGLVDQKYAMYLKDLCLSARFDITPNWIFKLEGHLMEGTALLYSSDDNTVTLGDGTVQTDYEKDWFMTAAKVSYSF